MSQEQPAKETSTEATGGRSLVRTLTLTGAVAVGLIGGAAVGFMVVSPAVDDRLEVSAAESAADVDVEDPGESDDRETPDLHLIENLVVNPAESEGLRFLLVTVAIDAASEDARSDVEAREVELRDALLRLFGSKTVAELADPTTRSELIEEVRLGVEAVIGDGTIRRVFVPQFVIQ